MHTKNVQTGKFINFLRLFSFSLKLLNILKSPVKKYYIPKITK